MKALHMIISVVVVSKFRSLPKWPIVLLTLANLRDIVIAEH